MPEQPTPKQAPPVINWSDNEAAALRAFLDKSPQFLAALRAKRPKITVAENIEARAMSGSEVKGAEHILEAIAQLAMGSDSILEVSPFIGREAE